MALSYYVKVVVQTELMSLDQALSKPLPEEIQRFDQHVLRHIEHTPAPSTGRPLNVVMSTTLPPVEQQGVVVDDPQRFPYLEADDNGEYVAIRLIYTYAVVFETESYDDVAAVLNAMAQDRELSTYSGLAWQWFDRE